MMKISTLLYTIKQGFVNIFRNKWYSLASVATISACLFLFGLFYAIIMNFQHVVQSAEEGVCVSVLFVEGTTEERMKEINDINVAELYKNGRILIPDAVAIPLEEDEYYTRDLYGMKVVTDEGEDLGELVRIYETGANDVYAVKKAEDKKELLIPAIKDCILKVDIKENTMTVHLLEGLR